MNGATAATSSAASAEPCQRILIVDDNDDARMLLADILGTFGHEVRSVPEGAAALVMAPLFRPSVVILDIGLPGMDGYQVAHELQKLMKDSLPKLIAVTGYGQPADRARSLAAGFDRHLVKPVEVRGVLTCIRELTSA
jgi:CheY-like chemotaxis protein